MSHIIGIDLGGSTTKIVGLSNGSIIGAAMVKSRRGMGITPILFSFAGWGWELIYRAPPGKDSAACLMTLTAKSTPYSLLMAR